MSPLAFDQEQAEKLTEIGAHLRSVRTQKGLALDEVAAKTMIQPRFVTAIEQGKIEELPEALYVRGFIRRMAEVMGLDGVALSESFPLGNDPNGSYNSSIRGPVNATLRPWHLYLIYFAAVLGAVTLLWALFRPQNTPQQPVAAPSPAVPAKPQPSVAAKPVAKPKPQTAPVQAQLTLKADSYLEISADGQANFTGTLKAGEKKTVTAKEEIRISAGNAGGVLLSVNSQPAKLMGQNGEVKGATLIPSSKGF